ncbi:Formin-like protein CG32138 [Eumeta japonica]|uniref:Formin-like protein CG32138 n=1 Tax=Eumeta variegata TaxID=151549 RepID=A0A4C1U477_EUMVA|nr:Formin-like protein CG32138 [Eumeta japonica]
MVGDSTSTQVLRDLEISLRTNHIDEGEFRWVAHCPLHHTTPSTSIPSIRYPIPTPQADAKPVTPLRMRVSIGEEPWCYRWVREFLNETNQGLDVLIDYLGFRLSMMRHEQRVALARSHSGDGLNQGLNTTTSDCSAPTESAACTLNSSWRRKRNGDESSVEGGAGDVRRRSRHAARLNMGASTDDIHVCIMCMRAIMNNKVGDHRQSRNLLPNIGFLITLSMAVTIMAIPQSVDG